MIFSNWCTTDVGAIWLETEIGAYLEPQGGNIWVIQVGKSLDQIQPDEGKYIIDSNSGLNIGLIG